MEKVDGVHANMSPQPFFRCNRMHKPQPAAVAAIAHDVRSLLRQCPQNDTNKYSIDPIRSEEQLGCTVCRRRCIPTPFANQHEDSHRQNSIFAEDKSTMHVQYDYSYYSTEYRMWIYQGSVHVSGRSRNGVLSLLARERASMHQKQRFQTQNPTNLIQSRWNSSVSAATIYSPVLKCKPPDGRM